MPAMPWMAPTLKGTEADERKRLEALAAKLDTGLQRAFLDAIERLKGRVDVDAIARLIAEGRVVDAIAIVSDATVRTGMSSIAAAITDAVLISGRAAAVAISQIRAFQNMEVNFRITNPRTMDFLNRYEMNLIAQMASESLANVRRVITDGVNAGRGPIDIARDVRQHIGLTRYQSQVVQNYRRNLEQLDPRALGRALRDQRNDGPVRRAIEAQEPLTPEKVDKLVANYEKRWLKYRAETIARTESIRSLNIGNQEAWTQAAESGQFPESKIVRKWVFTHDNRTREWHRNIPALNPDGVGLREPFKSDLGPIMFPGDPSAAAANTINCRCTTIIRYQPSRGD